MLHGAPKCQQGEPPARPARPPLARAHRARSASVSSELCGYVHYIVGMDPAEVAQLRAETPGLNAAGKLSGAYLNNAGAALMPQVVVRYDDPCT